MAKTVAYLDGKLASGPDAKNGALVPAGYAQQAKEVAERRIVLAGYRLTDLLALVFKP